MTFQERINKINEFEKIEGYPKDSLLRSMLFETAGTLSTTIKNPFSNAIGLIQFMPSTLAAMGLSTMVVSTFTFEQQLNLVRQYLKPYKTKLLSSKDPLDFYLVILYPALIGKPDSAIMGKKPEKVYTQNAGLDSNKDGVITKGDIRTHFYTATNRLAAKKGINFFNPGLSIIILVVSIAIIFLILKSNNYV